MMERSKTALALCAYRAHINLTITLLPEDVLYALMALSHRWEDKKNVRHVHQESTQEAQELHVLYVK